MNFDTDDDRLEHEYGGKRKTIYQEAKELYKIANKKYDKSLKECYDRLVKLRGYDDHSWNGD